MTDTLLVTSTQDSTGKTAITLALGLLARERGLDVGYMKPKGTRLQSNVGKTLDEDPMLARELLGLDSEMHQMEPVVYSPTFVEGAIRGKEDPDELAEVVREQFETLADGTDRMLVEGAGSYTTGGIIDLTDPEVADLLDAEAVLVADYARPTDLDDVLA
ncbi:AAA family ATPase, partial [Halobium palmae]